MKQRLFFLFAFVIALLGLVGCESRTQEESEIPWAQPAPWEGRMPGVGSGY